MYTCHVCNVVKGHERDSEHTCNENDKLTMQMIKNDSKKCPGCATFIFKLDGCDQMWCVNCHTAFSWRTGMVINGQIHNPHFYEFQRSNGAIERAVGDIPCGGIPSFREVHNAIRNQISDPSYDFLIKLHRIVLHIEHAELARYGHVITEANNIDLRVRYMLNEIQMQEFKSKIQQREKASEKKREIYMILHMFVITMSDYYRQIIQSRNLELVGEIEELISYTNKSMMTVSRRYDCVVPNIDPQVRFVHTRYS